MNGQQPLALIRTDRETLIRMLAALQDIFGGEMTDTRLEGYIAALSDIPTDDLRLGMQRAVRACTWFPKPAEIRRAVDAELAARVKVEPLVEQVVPDWDARVAVSCPACDDSGWRNHINGGPPFERAYDAQVAALMDRTAVLSQSPCPCAPHNPVIRRRLEKAGRKYAEDQP